MQPRTQSRKDTASLTCLGCKQLFVPKEGMLRLTCKPDFHTFCSAKCLVRFLHDQQRRGLMVDNVAHCPSCGFPINPDLISQAYASPQPQEPELQSATTECGECKKLKPAVTYTCGHSLCEECRGKLKASMKEAEYEYKAGDDPNCMLCHKPESWLSKNFSKAKTFATSDTGVSVLKGVGEQGYKYCCSDCVLA